MIEDALNHRLPRLALVPGPLLFLVPIDPWLVVGEQRLYVTSMGGFALRALVGTAVDLRLALATRNQCAWNQSDLLQQNVQRPDSRVATTGCSQKQRTDEVRQGVMIAGLGGLREIRRPNSANRR